MPTGASHTWKCTNVNAHIAGLAIALAIGAGKMVAMAINAITATRNRND